MFWPGAPGAGERQGLGRREALSGSVHLRDRAAVGPRHRGRDTAFHRGRRGSTLRRGAPAEDGARGPVAGDVRPRRPGGVGRGGDDDGGRASGAHDALRITFETVWERAITFEEASTPFVRSRPSAEVAALLGVTHIAVGHQFACAIVDPGDVCCWAILAGRSATAGRRGSRPSDGPRPGRTRP